jgi:phage-related protein
MGNKGIKPLRWVASSLRDLQDMPDEVQDSFGFALHMAQIGGKHGKAKALKGFGSAGVLEVVEDSDGSTYRAVYTVRFQGIATPKQDMELVVKRLKIAETLAKGAQK